MSRNIELQSTALVQWFPDPSPDNLLVERIENVHRANNSGAKITERTSGMSAESTAHKSHSANKVVALEKLKLLLDQVWKSK